MHASRTGLAGEGGVQAPASGRWWWQLMAAAPGPGKLEMRRNGAQCVESGIATKQ